MLKMALIFRGDTLNLRGRCCPFLDRIESCLNVALDNHAKIDLEVARHRAANLIIKVQLCLLHVARGKLSIGKRSVADEGPVHQNDGVVEAGCHCVTAKSVQEHRQLRLKSIPLLVAVVFVEPDVVRWGWFGDQVRLYISSFELLMQAIRKCCLACADKSFDSYNHIFS